MSATRLTAVGPAWADPLAIELPFVPATSAAEHQPLREYSHDQ
jgi:hypothetical protein